MDLIPLFPTEVIENDTEINLGEKKLKLIHCPGHTYDSILVYDAENKLVVAGDNILSKEVEFFLPPLTHDDELDSDYKYLESAYNKIESLQADIIIPGHGLTLDPTELISLNRTRYNNAIKNLV